MKKNKLPKILKLENRIELSTQEIDAITRHAYDEDKEKLKKEIRILEKM